MEGGPSHCIDQLPIRVHAVYRVRAFSSNTFSLPVPEIKRWVTFFVSDVSSTFLSVLSSSLVAQSRRSATSHGEDDGRSATSTHRIPPWSID